MNDSYPLPEITPINRPFWKHSTEGELRLQRCDDCQELTFPPRVTCPRCFGELSWEEVSGRGTLYTYGVVHRPTHPEVFDERVPFVLGVAELDAGPRITAHVDCEPESVEVGMATDTVFEAVSDEISVPVFVPRE